MAQGSNLTAGGNLTLDATAGNVTVTGSSLTGQNILLAATQDVTLNAAQSTSTTNASNSSGGWNVGVSFGVTSESAGLGVFANGYAASGKANGTGVVNDDTTVTAGQNLIVSAGNDVTLSGAQAKGNDIILNAGNDLNLVSLQDTNSYKSTQQSVSGGVAVSESGGSGSASFSQSTVASTYASVNQQTGLFAGSGGFQINVGNNTNLTGAVVASTAPASDNILATNTLTFSNIVNSASYSATTVGGSLSSGSLVGSAALSAVGTAGGLLGLRPQGNASGTTSSAISAGTIDVLSGGSTAGLSRDISGTNGSVAPIFNLQTLQDNAAVGRAFGQVANQVAGDVIAASAWSEDSTQGILLHGLVGAVQGQLSGGNVLAGAAGGAASAASGTGAQSGGLTGGQTSLSSTTNNYLNHVQLEALLAVFTDPNATDADKAAATATAETQSNANSAALQSCNTSQCFADAANEMAGNSTPVSQNLGVLNGTSFTTQTGQQTAVSTLVFGSPTAGGVYADADLANNLADSPTLASVYGSMHNASTNPVPIVVGPGLGAIGTAAQIGEEAGTVAGTTVETEANAAAGTTSPPTQQTPVVPPGYSAATNADGSFTVTGPQSGIYKSTGLSDPNTGYPIFQTSTGSYVTLEGGNTSVPSPNVANGGSTIQQNYASGIQFQKTAQTILNGTQNTTALTETLPNGNVVNTVPDGLTSTTMTEIKSDVYLTSSDQLQAQMQNATRNGLSYNLIMSPDTTVSGSCLNR